MTDPQPASTMAPLLDGIAGSEWLITAPGIYSITSEQYHGHPTPTPCLGSTGARLLVNTCPAEFRYKADNPEVKTEFDIGNATHLLVLQPEDFDKKVGVVRGVTKDGKPSGGYQTQDAKDQAAAYRAANRIPLLVDQYDKVCAMRASVFNHPIAGRAFQDGEAEQSLFWKHPEFGFWGKTRPDYWPERRPYLVDLKTSVSAAPDDFSKAVVNYGYHQQCAWYLDGVAAITGENPDRFAFVVVEKEPPYLVSVCWLDSAAIEWGRILNRRAAGVFAWCLEHDRWPGFQPDVAQAPAAFNVSLPVWALRDLERRFEAGEFNVPQEQV